MLQANGNPGSGAKDVLTVNKSQLSVQQPVSSAG